MLINERIEMIFLFVEKSLEKRLSKLESLVEKNKRELQKTKIIFCRSGDIVYKLKEKFGVESGLSEDIRLCFALAKGDRLHLADRVFDTSILRTNSSRSPMLRHRNKILSPSMNRSSMGTLSKRV